MMRASYFTVTCCLGLVLLISKFASAQTVQVREDFSKDHKWQGRNNVMDPANCVKKEQDFGYSATSHAGGAPGEIGGKVWRSLRPASYLTAIPTRTLNDRLHAFGRFAVTHSDGSSDVLFGWFNSKSRGWRPASSIFIAINGEQDKFRLFFQYSTQTWEVGGGQTFEGRYQTTKTPMYPADGTPHMWSYDYDPDGAGGQGELTFVIDGKVFTAPLVEGHKAKGAIFDRFGLANVETSGSSMTLWFDDIEWDSHREDFSADPHWIEIGNRVRFTDCVVRPFDDFGWRNSHRAGGEPGEVGGLIWRNEAAEPEHAFYYGMPIGKLSLENELKASGRVAMKNAAPDSAILFGWFNPLTSIGAPPMNFLGIFIEGPSVIGHYVRPILRNATEDIARLASGPVIRPDGTRHRWTLHYVPGPKGQPGKVTMALDDETIELDVDPARVFVSGASAGGHLAGNGAFVP